MNILPLRFRDMGKDGILLSDETGRFFKSDRSFLKRYASGSLTQSDERFLLANGHAFNAVGDLQHTAIAYRWLSRLSQPRSLSYVLLVPTLRCDLACGYCQVSRANQNATGYDWSEETLAAALRFLDNLDTDEVKIEFQGGEPLLRLDLLESVRAFCRERFANSSFVVCTNLSRFDAETIRFFDCSDTSISTSLDGPSHIHKTNRTKSSALTAQFFQNLDEAIRQFGIERISALPTIDIRTPPSYPELIDTYRHYGFKSIYLRPVNYHGFARRDYPSDQYTREWNAYYTGFINELIRRNYDDVDAMDEYYFRLCLRRFLQPGHDGHTDLRNPSYLGVDHLVVDYDGRLYPTDEARMLRRSGQIDLSIGDVCSGIDHEKVATLNEQVLNNFNADCVHCPYQPCCGADPIDDIARYGRIDVPRSATWFCNRHLHIFDLVAQLLYSDKPEVQHSLQLWLGLGSWPREITVHHDDSSSPPH